jgi:hypothetical protein
MRVPDPRSDARRGVEPRRIAPAKSPGRPTRSPLHRPLRGIAEKVLVGFGIAAVCLGPLAGPAAAGITAPATPGAAAPAATVTGQVSAWGSNSTGQTTVPTGLAGVTSVAGGVGFSVALKSTGAVVAWGDNGYGQTSVPTAAQSNITAIAAGWFHCLALKTDGTVVGWGDNSSGGTTVPAGLSGVRAVAAGDGFSLALKTDGTVVGWGSNASGQVTIPAGLSGVTAIAAGGFHGLALKSNGTVVAWGLDGSHQTEVPTGLTGVTAIAGGGWFSLALKSNGTVVGWGENTYGQTTVPAGLSGISSIAAGEYHSLALAAGGTVVAWGMNSSGDTSVPGGLSGVTAIAGGGYHSLAAWSSTSPGPTLTVGGFPSPTIAGAAHNITVTALDSSGNTATGYRGTVHFASSDAAAILPANYTFTAGDSGVHVFSVTLRTVGTRSVTVTDTVTASITGSQTAIVVTGTPQATSGATWVPLTPNRLVDSRPGAEQTGLTARVSNNVPVSFIVTDRSPGDVTRNVPANAVAVTGNLTVVGQSHAGYLALTPDKPIGSPTTSTLNFPYGDTRANAVTVPLGTGGVLWVTYVAGVAATTDVVFDVTGFFLPHP